MFSKLPSDLNNTKKFTDYCLEHLTEDQYTNSLKIARTLY